MVVRGADHRPSQRPKQQLDKPERYEPSLSNPIEQIKTELRVTLLQVQNKE